MDLQCTYEIHARPNRQTTKSKASHHVRCSPDRQWDSSPCTSGRCIVNTTPCLWEGPVFPYECAPSPNRAKKTLQMRHWNIRLPVCVCATFFNEPNGWKFLPHKHGRFHTPMAWIPMDIHFWYQFWSKWPRSCPFGWSWVVLHVHLTCQHDFEQYLTTKVRSHQTQTGTLPRAHTSKRWHFFTLDTQFLHRTDIIPFQLIVGCTPPYMPTWLWTQIGNEEHTLQKGGTFSHSTLSFFLHRTAHRHETNAYLLRIPFDIFLPIFQHRHPLLQANVVASEELLPRFRRHDTTVTHDRGKNMKQHCHP